MGARTRLGGSGSFPRELGPPPRADAGRGAAKIWCARSPAALGSSGGGSGGGGAARRGTARRRGVDPRRRATRAELQRWSWRGLRDGGLGASATVARRLRGGTAAAAALWRRYRGATAALWRRYRGALATVPRRFGDGTAALGDALATVCGAFGDASRGSPQTVADRRADRRGPPRYRRGRDARASPSVAKYRENLRGCSACRCLRGELTWHRLHICAQPTQKERI